MIVLFRVITTVVSTLFRRGPSAGNPSRILEQDSFKFDFKCTSERGKSKINKTWNSSGEVTVIHWKIYKEKKSLATLHLDSFPKPPRRELTCYYVMKGTGRDFKDDEESAGCLCSRSCSRWRCVWVSSSDTYKEQVVTFYKIRWLRCYVLFST